MRERQIENRIWEIIHEEITNARLNPEKPTKYFHDRIKRRINDLLNRHEAILVYQP